MKDTLIFALDRTGCLQIASWREASRGRVPPNGSRRARKRQALAQEIPEANKDALAKMSEFSDPGLPRSWKERS